MEPLENFYILRVILRKTQTVKIIVHIYIVTLILVFSL